MGVRAVKDFVGDTKACFVFGMTVVPTLPFSQIGPDLKNIYNMQVQYAATNKR